MATDTGFGERLRALPWRAAGWGGAAFVLLLPLVTNAPWTLSDYVFMGILLGGVGFGLELALRKSNRAYTMAAGVALAAAFLLVWINAAVGIIGNEAEAANILFLGVLAVALLGCLAALLRPARMSWAMLAAALAQLSVPLVASILMPEAMAAIWAPEVVVLTGFFAGMWLGSAWLFRRAAG